jgi:hypothetical protein
VGIFQAFRLIKVVRIRKKLGKSVVVFLFYHIDLVNFFFDLTKVIIVGRMGKKWAKY